MCALCWLLQALLWNTFLFIKALCILVFFYFDILYFAFTCVTCVNPPCVSVKLAACQCAFCLLKHLGELRSKALRTADVESRGCVKYVESGNARRRTGWAALSSPFVYDAGWLLTVWGVSRRSEVSRWLQGSFRDALCLVFFDRLVRWQHRVSSLVDALSLSFTAAHAVKHLLAVYLCHVVA